jgi:ribonuclease HI
MSRETYLSILQYNTRKSRKQVMASFLRDPKVLEYDILAIQEPWRNKHMATTHNPVAQNYHLLFPKDTLEQPARTCFFVSKRLDNTKWRFTDHNRDMGSLTIQTSNKAGEAKEITIYNVYNPLATKYEESTLPILNEALHNRTDEKIILGDFNLHHEMWAGTNITNSDAEAIHLITLIQDHSLFRCLPKGTTTREEGGLSSCIDLVYASPYIVSRIIQSRVDRELDHHSDHLPISTIIGLEIPDAPVRETWLWNKIDDKTFQRTLRETLPRFYDAKTANEIEQYTMSIVNSLLSAIDASTPKRRSPNHFSVPGFTEACKRAQMEARRLKRIHSDEHSDESREAYKRARNWKGRVIGKALKTAYRERVEEASKSPEQMWKLAKWSRNRGENACPLLPALRDTAGQLRTNAADKADLLRHAFFPTPPDPDLSDIEGFQYPSPIVLEPITRREIREAIMKAPANKAPGADGIPNNVLHKAINQILVHLEHLFNACLQIGYCPEHFKTSTTIVLRKLGKESYQEAKSYRPIALLSTLGKAMESVLASRISYCVEKYSLLPDYHIGGRKARSTEMAIHHILETIHMAWDEKKVASLLLLDVSGAYDNVSHKRLLHNLQKRQIDTSIITWLQSFLTNRSTAICFDGYKSTPYTTSTGIPQGSPLSPILYLFYNADLVETCNSEPNTKALGYVDDIGVLTWSKSTKENCERLKTIHQKAQIWATRHSSVFAPSKYQLTHHTRRAAEFQLDEAMTIQEVEIRPSAKCKYLGLIIDTKLKWKAHIDWIKGKANKSIQALSCLAGSTWGIKLKDMRTIYEAVVIPQIFFACSAWGVTKNTGDGHTKELVDSLDSIQAKAALVISGAFRATSIPALNAETFLLPMKQRLWKERNLALTRLLTATTTLQIRPPARSTRNTHIAPLQFLFRGLAAQTAVDLQSLEKIPPIITAPWWQPPKISIHKTKKEATRHLEYHRTIYPEAIEIYTDGSGIEHKIGAAAVAPLLGRAKKTFMGDDHTSTVYAAELKGIYLALKIAQQEIGDSRREILIYTDNQAAIQIIEKPRCRSGSYLLTEIIDLLEELRPRTRYIEISWIPAHTGIPGNEAADLAAKEATGWRDNNHGPRARPSAPPRQLYSLKSTLITWIKQTAASRWTTEWANEPRGRRSYRYTPIPGTKVLGFHQNATKRLSSIIIQLRTGKIALNAYLHSRKVPGIDSPNCTCGFRLQTIEHILLDCRKYRDLRRHYLGPGRMTVEEILSTPKLTLKAAEFMEATQLLGQFRRPEEEEVYYE